MTDTLRTRIAAALYGQLFWISTPFEDQPDDVKDMWLFQADIVIRELGLREQWATSMDHASEDMIQECREEAIFDDGSPNLVHRYVTEWTPDNA